jgi:hypothetical protein
MCHLAASQGAMIHKYRGIMIGEGGTRNLKENLLRFNTVDHETQKIPGDL